MGLTFTAVSQPDDDDKLHKKPKGTHFLDWDSLRSTSEPEPEAPEAASNEPEIEVVYERPGRGNDEIEALQEQYEAEKEARATADRIAVEQAQRARAYESVLEVQGHKAALADACHQEAENLRQAQLRQVAAGNSYDHETVAVAAAHIAVHAQRLEEYGRAYESISEQEAEARRIAQQPQQPQLTSDQQFESAISHYSERDKGWIRRNRDDLLANPERVKLAETSAQFAERRHGIEPGSDEFYTFLDEAMGYDGDGAEAPQPTKKSRRQGGATKRMYAAPSSRATSSSPRGSVHLSEFDQAQAKELGISFRDYAAIKAKANKREGQLSMAEAGGRMHFRASLEDHY
jgi:hypothetical protein